MALAISSTPSKWLWVTNRLSSLGYSCLPLAIRDFLEPSDPVVKCRRKHGYVKRVSACACMYIHRTNSSQLTVRSPSASKVLQSARAFSTVTCLPREWRKRSISLSSRPSTRDRVKLNGLGMTPLRMEPMVCSSLHCCQHRRI